MIRSLPHRYRVILRAQCGFSGEPQKMRPQRLDILEISARPDHSRARHQLEARATRV